MANIFFKIGNIKKEKTDDPGGAIEAFNAVLEVNPNHPGILDTLLKHYEEAGDWSRYTSVLEKKLGATQDKAEKADVLVRLGKLARDKLADKARSLAYIEQAHGLNPKDVKVQKALIDALLEAGDNDKAAGLIEQLIEAEEKKGVKKSKELIEKLDRLEADWHNPKAEVTYDILAMKGGAKLYSQLGQLYEFAKDSDGPVTQGMREVYQENKTTLERLLREQATLVRELESLNDAARTLRVPHILVPAKE